MTIQPGVRENTLTPNSVARGSGGSGPSFLGCLLRGGASVSGTYAGKYTSLLVAARLGAKKCIEVLVQHNSDLHLKN